MFTPKSSPKSQEIIGGYRWYSINHAQSWVVYLCSPPFLQLPEDDENSDSAEVFSGKWVKLDHLCSKREST